MEGYGKPVVPDGTHPPWVIVSPPRGETARTQARRAPKERSKPVLALGFQAFLGAPLEPQEGVLGRFCGVKKILSGVTKNLGGVTKISGGPAGKFCHMKKSLVGQTKCVFGDSREFCGASRKFRNVSFKFCGVAEEFCDVTGHFRDASGAFCHVSRKFCGVAGGKPRIAARSQAPTTAQPRSPKNVFASGDLSAPRRVRRATAGAFV